MKKTKKILLLTLCVLLGTNAAFAQQRLVTATVIDNSTGEALPFVSVAIKELKTVTTTTELGTFSIEVPSPETILQFSFIGYETLEISAGKIDGTVRLESIASALDAVIVTGYQTLAREKVTGAVAMVSSTALQERYTPNIMQNMEGRVAGLVVDGDRLTIRGTGSLYAENNPLIVVDGLPIEGSWRDLNPYDIESVTVLKDAAAAAMYGARASAGIIVITTKKPQVAGRINVDVQANFSISQKRNLDYADNFYMTPAQQVDAEADYYKYRYITEDNAASNRLAFRTNTVDKNAVFTPIQYAYYQLGEGFINQAQLDGLLSQLRKNNYAKEYADNVLLHRFVQQYNVAIRSMTEKFQSNLVINQKHDNMGYIHQGDNQFNLFYKGEYKMTNWLTLNFSVNGILQNQHYSSYDGWLNKARDPFSELAYARLLNDDGSFANNTRFGNGLFIDDPAFRPTHYNAMEEMAYDQTKFDRQSTRYQGGLLFNIIDGLTAQAQFIYETDRRTTTVYSEADSYLMRMMRNAYTKLENGVPEYMIPETGGRLISENYKGDYWTARGQVNFSRTFNDKHAIDFLAGLEFRQTRYNGTRSILMGYDDQLQTQNTSNLNLAELRDWAINPYYYDMSTSSFFGLIGNNMGLIPEEWHRYASGYANLTYTYDGKYNAFASFRKDYADVYGLENKYRGKPLWSVGLSWVASNEDFMKDIKWVNYLKVRGSYGITGNIVQNVTSVMVATTSIPVNTWTQQPRARIDRPANPYLTWEKTTTTNLGVDFGLLNTRLRGALDWYYKKADDVFALKNLEPTMGFSEMWLNMASLYNNGVELSLTYDWFTSKNREQFAWSTSLTSAYNHNKVTYVESLAKTAGGLAGDYRYMEGYATSAMWSYVFGGLDDEGRRTYLAPDGTKLTGNQISAKDLDALVYSGQRDPKVTMGLENTFRYKGFSLNIMAVYYGGHKMRCLQTNSLSSPNGVYNAGPMPAYLLRAWTPENPNTDVPGNFQNNKTIGTENSGEYNNLDIFVQPADFIKLRNIIFGYDLPQKWTEKIGIQNATIRFQIDNSPALWTKNNVGVDPEAVYNRSYPLPISQTVGMNPDNGYGGVRRPTTFIIGLNLNF